MLLAILAAADAPQAVSLLDFDIKSLLAVGAAAVGLVGWIVAQNRRLDAKAAAADLDARTKALEAAVGAVREELRGRLEEMRRDLDEKLERKASKSEVIAHATLIAEQSKLSAVIQAELTALGKRVDELRDMVRQLLDRER